MITNDFRNKYHPVDDSDLDCGGGPVAKRGLTAFSSVQKILRLCILRCIRFLRNGSTFTADIFLNETLIMCSSGLGRINSANCSKLKLFPEANFEAIIACGLEGGRRVATLVFQPTTKCHKGH